MLLDNGASGRNMTESNERKNPTPQPGTTPALKTTILRPNRLVFLGALGSGAAFFTTRGLFAEQLAPTPQREEGPFYPDKLPLDTDNDLIIVGDSLTPAVGEI